MASGNRHARGGATLLFTNTRSQAERWYQALLEARPDWAGTIALHHGSLSGEVRGWVEAGLKAGTLKAVVCTSSLDLGVDFLPVEQVLQLAGAAAALAAAGRYLGLSMSAAALVGIILALSSTAFVLPTLAERRELSTRHGREAFAILLFQDLSVIPLLALIPLFGTGKPTALTHPAVGLGLLVVVALIGRPLLDALFRHVARVNSREMFTAAALVTVLGLALMMQAGGLSMSLGAFVAGVLLADSEFRHELEASIAPFQGLLLGLFFMAVGMSTNLSLLVKFPWQILGLTVGLIVIKFVMLYGLRRLIGGQRADARRPPSRPPSA